MRILENWKQTPSLFIISTGRVGSMMSIRLLKMSKKVHAYHEPKPHLLDETVAAFHDLDKKKEEYTRKLMNAKRWKIAYAHLRQKHYIESTVNLSLAPILQEQFPNSKFVHLHRRPEEVIASGMNRQWYNGHTWDKYRIQPHEQNPVRAAWDKEWTPFEKLCWNWSFINNFCLKIGRMVGEDRFISLSFHNLINVETRTYKQIFDFAGLEAPVHQMAVQVLEIPVNAQKVRSFPGWENWTSFQKKRMLEIASGTMKSLNYKPLR